MELFSFSVYLVKNCDNKKTTTTVPDGHSTVLKEQHDDTRKVMNRST